jgi:isopentenyl-diphosphate Delta-isomerase
VGSQRRELESQLSENVDRWKVLRQESPRVTMFANLGISQLIHAPLAQVRKLVDSLEAQALMIHANALQEVMQPEGTPQFKGALNALKRLCAEIGVPVAVKETGCGFSAATLRRLRDIGIVAVDVSGLGGTHWGRLEGARADEGSVHAVAAQTFADWGEPTVESVIAARHELSSSTEVWASGGVRTGLDAAKLIALGANQVGFAKPALEAALAGEEELRQWMAAREYELRVALFCTGCESPSMLREKEGVWKLNAV